ncbi:MAG: tetratricopeptide repeat protein, partial [Chloroflexi bacterium]|nr:tetratricopeptide repeat protein [Chloroflexota bacterium]
QRDYAAAQAYYQEALDIYRDIGDRHSEAVAVGGLGDIALYQGDYATAWACHEAARRSHAQGGTRTGEGIALGNLGLICQHQGDYGAARRYYEQALALCRAIGFPRGENWWLAYLALLAHHEGDDEAALAYGEQALQMAQDRGDQPLCGYAWLHRAHALAALSRWPAAADAYGQALTIRQELDQPHLAVEARAGLARVALARGDLAVAVAQVVEIQRYLDDHPLDGTEEPGRVYWTCYQVWQAVQDPRAPALLEAAYHLLQERSARIGDAGLRRSFLQRVAIHRAIIDEWQEQHK